MPSRISLCLIVRDEAANLPACLTPLAGLFDETIVVDTGSTDDTRAVAAALGARVFDFAWNDDFSAARNEMLRHATGDWIFWMDADDRLDAVNVDRLRQVLAGLGTDQAIYFMDCFSRVGSSATDGHTLAHPRLFPRLAGLRWHRRIHEELAAADGRRTPPVRFAGVRIDHLGYQDPPLRLAKLRRDLGLLQNAFALDPDDAVTLFYLGWTHFALGHAAAAVPFLQRAVARDPGNCRAACELARALRAQGRTAEALAACNAGIGHYPDHTELWYQRGNLLCDLRDVASAEACYVRVIGASPVRHMPYGMQTGLVEMARVKLGQICVAQGRKGEAENQYLAALAVEPRYTLAWSALGQLYLRQGRFAELQDLLPRLAACDGGKGFALVMAAQAWLVTRDFGRARALLEEAIARDPQMLWARLTLIDLLVAQGASPEVLIRVHLDVLEIEPQHAETLRRLKELYQAAGQPDGNAARGRQDSEISRLGSMTLVTQR